jgi:hypothetical protein
MTSMRLRTACTLAGGQITDGSGDFPGFDRAAWPRLPRTFEQHKRNRVAAAALLVEGGGANNRVRIRAVESGRQVVTDQ